MRLAVSFSNLDGILSGPDALCMSKSSKSFWTPIGLMSGVEISGVWDPWIVGSESKSSSVNTDEKCLFKISALSLLSVYTCP